MRSLHWARIISVSIGLKIVHPSLPASVILLSTRPPSTTGRNGCGTVNTQRTADRTVRRGRSRGGRLSGSVGRCVAKPFRWQIHSTNGRSIDECQRRATPFADRQAVAPREAASGPIPIVGCFFSRMSYARSSNACYRSTSACRSAELRTISVRRGTINQSLCASIHRNMRDLHCPFVDVLPLSTRQTTISQSTRLVIRFV